MSSIFNTNARSSTNTRVNDLIVDGSASFANNGLIGNLVLGGSAVIDLPPDGDPDLQLVLPNVLLNKGVNYAPLTGVITISPYATISYILDYHITTPDNGQGNTTVTFNLVDLAGPTVIDTFTTGNIAENTADEAGRFSPAQYTNLTNAAKQLTITVSQSQANAVNVARLLATTQGTALVFA